MTEPYTGEGWEPGAPRVCSQCGEKVKQKERITCFPVGKDPYTLHLHCMPYSIPVLIHDGCEGCKMIESMWLDHREAHRIGYDI